MNPRFSWSIIKTGTYVCFVGVPELVIHRPPSFVLTKELVHPRLFSVADKELEIHAIDDGTKIQRDLYSAFC